MTWNCYLSTYLFDQIPTCLTLELISKTMPAMTQWC